MDRNEFKKRMQSLKSYREQNPDKGYWDWKEDIPEYKDGGIHIKPENRGKFTRLKERTGKSATWFKKHGTPEQKKMATFALNAKKWKHADGGEVEPDNSPARVNPITGKPLASGIATPVLSLEAAAGFTPIGDVMSIRDAYIAAQNNDLLGLGLAGLGVIPFIPRVNRNHFAERFAEMEKRDARKHEALDEYFKQRNSVYEDLIENEEAYRKAANADRVSKSNYRQTYGDIIRAYSNDASNYNPDLTQPAFGRYLDGTETKAQVDPSNLGYIYLNPRYADPNELDDVFKTINPGLIRHELGHEIDVRSGLDYTNRLSDPDKFVSDEKLKEMYPKTHEQFRNNVLNRGSEIKSYMNEFRDYLINKGRWDEKETIHTFKNKLDEYGKDFPMLRRIFDSYKSKRQFIKDYNTVPIAVNNQDITIS